MALHGLGKVTIGVPNPAETISYYTDFGLDHLGEGRFATRDGGEQLQVVHAPLRKLLDLTVAADDSDDIASVAGKLAAIGVSSDSNPLSVRAVEPVTGTVVRVLVRPRIITEPAVAPTPYNGPGRIDRWGRAPFLSRTEPVRPRKLGHAVLGSTDLATTMRFFVDGLGFKVSDYMGDKAAFLQLLGGTPQCAGAGRAGQLHASHELAGRRHRRGGPGRAVDARRPSRTSHLGSGPPFRWRRALDAAVAAQDGWAETAPRSRSEILRRTW